MEMLGQGIMFCCGSYSVGWKLAWCHSWLVPASVHFPPPGAHRLASDPPQAGHRAFAAQGHRPGVHPLHGDSLSTTTGQPRAGH